MGETAEMSAMSAPDYALVSDIERRAQGQTGVWLHAGEVARVLSIVESLDYAVDWFAAELFAADEEHKAMKRQ